MSIWNFIKRAVETPEVETGFVEGWSIPASQGDYSPPCVWVKKRRARKADIDALLRHRIGQIRGVDYRSLVGKGSASYKTYKDAL